MSGPGNSGVPRSLAEVGFRIVPLFESLAQRWHDIDDHLGLDGEKVANEQDRFNLWAVNLGLHQRGHASLDYRFRDAENLYQYSMKLLDDLLHALKSINGDLFERVADDSEQAESADELLSDSDDSASSEGFGDETSAQAAFKSVVDSIDRLFKLAMRVRNPATRMGLSKGYLYEEVDQDSSVGLFHSFQELRIDELHIQQLIQSYPGSRHGKGIDASFLVDRLARANNKRRRQFAYWKHHKLNQIRHTEIAKQKVAQQIQFPSAELAPSASGHSKPTTATHVDHTKIDLDDARSAFSTISVVLPEPTKADEAIEFPPVPEKYASQESLKEFECPYCFTICSKRLLRKQIWSDHIIKDLRPYVCTFENCKEASQLYGSFTDWINHEFQAHGIAQHGSANDTTERPFPTARGSDVPAGAATANLTLARGRKCPLCQASFDAFDQAERHIANHLIRIALFALPRSTDTEPVDDAQETDSKKNTSNLANEDSLQLSSVRSVISFDSMPGSPREAVQGPRSRSTSASIASTTVTWLDIEHLPASKPTSSKPSRPLGAKRHIRNVSANVGSSPHIIIDDDDGDLEIDMGSPLPDVERLPTAPGEEILGGEGGETVTEPTSRDSTIHIDHIHGETRFPERTVDIRMLDDLRYTYHLEGGSVIVLQILDPVVIAEICLRSGLGPALQISSTSQLADGSATITQIYQTKDLVVLGKDGQLSTIPDTDAVHSDDTPEVYRTATGNGTMDETPQRTEPVQPVEIEDEAPKVNLQGTDGFRRGRFMPAGNAIKEGHPEAEAETGTATGAQAEESSSTDDRDLWTEVPKFMVEKEALEQLGHEYEETDNYFYTPGYLQSEVVSRLVKLSEEKRREIRDETIAENPVSPASDVEGLPATKPDEVGEEEVPIERSRPLQSRILLPPLPLPVKGSMRIITHYPPKDPNAPNQSREGYPSTPVLGEVTHTRMPVGDQVKVVSSDRVVQNKDEDGQYRSGERASRTPFLRTRPSRYPPRHPSPKPTGGWS